MKVRHLAYGILLVMLTAVTAFVVIMPISTLVMVLPSLEELWYDDALVEGLRAAAPKQGLVRSANVTAGLIDVLPTGMSREQATSYLNDNGFACVAGEATSTNDGPLKCKRVTGRTACGETWTVRLSFALDRTIVDRSATRDVVCF